MYKVKADELFKILSKIMNETYNEESNTVFVKLEEAIQIIEEKLIPTIENISYSKKYDLIEKIKNICNTMFLYLYFPNIIGTNVVGICPNSKDYKVIYKRFLKNVLEEKMAAHNFLDRIKNKFGYDIGKYAITDTVPTIIYNNDRDEMINTLNISENKVFLSNDDYVDFLSYSITNELEISSLIYALAFPCVLKGKSSYIINPDKVHPNSKYYKAFNELLDVLIICDDDYSNEILDKYSNLSKVYLISHTSEKKLNVLQEIANHYGVEIKIFHNLDDALNESEKCEVKNNFCYDTVLKNILYEILWYLADKKQNLSVPIKEINDNLLFKDDMSYKSVKELQNFYSDRIGEVNIAFNQYMTICNEFLEKIREIESTISINENEDRINDHIKMIPIVLELLIKTVKFQSVFPNDNSKAYVRYYADILAKLTGNKNLSDVITFNFLNKSLSKEQITEFKNIRFDSEFFIRYKIEIYQQLGLSIKECTNLIKKLSGDLRTNEKYILAQSYILYSQNEEAKKMLLEAVAEGCEDAGKMFMSFFGPNEDELRQLADMGVADAAYALGISKYNKNKNDDKVLKYLHIAASKKHLNAIQLLGDIAYDAYYDLEKNETYAEQAKQYYLMAIKLGSKDVKVKEKIGILCYDMRNYKSSIKYFKMSNTAHSNYMLGTIYESGNGVAVDYQQALKYYETAMQNGHSSAQVSYERLNAKIEAEKAKNTIEENKSYSSYTYYSSSYYSSYYSSGW